MSTPFPSESLSLVCSGESKENPCQSQCQITREKFEKAVKDPDLKPLYFNSNGRCDNCDHKISRHPSAPVLGLAAIHELGAKIDRLSANVALIATQSLDPWNRIEKASKSTNPDRTSKVKAYYGISDKFYCQVLGEVKEDGNQRQDHQPTVKNAHIWPQHTLGDGLNYFNLSSLDLDDERNMMRLHFAIEAAFDVKRLCFVGFPQDDSPAPGIASAPPTPSFASSPSPLSPSGPDTRRLFGLRVRVLDPKLLTEPIGVTGKTFAEIQDTDVKFLNPNRPFFRLIYAHYRRSMIYAQRMGWTDESEEEHSQRVAHEELLRSSLDTEFSQRIMDWLHRHDQPSSGGAVGVPKLPSSSAPASQLPETKEEKTCSEPSCRHPRANKCPKKLCGTHCKQTGTCGQHGQHRRKK